MELLEKRLRASNAVRLENNSDDSILDLLQFFRDVVGRTEEKSLLWTEHAGEGSSNPL